MEEPQKFNPMDHLQTVKWWNKKKKREEEYQIMPAGVRIQWFRSEEPDTRITTDVQLVQDGVALVSANIWTEDGAVRQSAHRLIARTEFKGFVEKAETQAIARAIRFAGYGAHIEEDGMATLEERGTQQQQGPEAVEAKVDPDTGEVLEMDESTFWRTLNRIEGRVSQKTHKLVKLAIAKHTDEHGTDFAAAMNWMQAQGDKPTEAEPSEDEVKAEPTESTESNVEALAYITQLVQQVGALESHLQDSPISKAQVKTLGGFFTATFKGEPDAKVAKQACLHNIFHVNSTKDLNMAQASVLITWLKDEDTWELNMDAAHEALVIAKMALPGQDGLPGIK
jgi:hypothetical protein